jgi:pyrrolysine biosynthesis protein PylC
MRVAVIGGKLQGIETCYLAHRAGWETVLIDKDPTVPATGLCHDFFCLDIVKEPERVAAAIHDVDFVIPALEDPDVLLTLSAVAEKNGAPVALDLNSYAITSSKKKSDDLFDRLGLAAPRRWPDCGFPVIVKPTGSSGSHGVTRIDDQEMLDRFLVENPSHLLEWVVQELVEGPAYSLEVIGLSGEAVALQTTELEVDSTFDCKRVIAPADLSPDLDEQLREIGTSLARTLRLNGVMDVEVVLHDGRLKILEIDARLPSQTPTVVERSAGLNMLELLAEVYLQSRLPAISMKEDCCGVVYEHVRFAGSDLEVSGEHIMAGTGRLRMAVDFFGADMALTDYQAPDRPWAATLIICEKDLEKAWAKRAGVIRAIMDTCQVSNNKDPGPCFSGASKGG